MVLLLLAASCCFPLTAPESTEVAPTDAAAAGDPAASAVAEGLVTYGNVTVAAAPVPARFHAPPSPTLREGWGAATPPRAWFQARLRRGDEQVWASAAQVLQTAADPLATELEYASLVRYGVAPEACEQAVAWHARTGGERRLADLVLAGCGTPAGDALLLAEDTSPAAVAARLMSYTPSPPEIRALAPQVVEQLGPRLQKFDADDIQREASRTPADDPADPCAGDAWKTGDPWQRGECLMKLASTDWAAARALVPATDRTEAESTLAAWDSAEAWEADLRKAGLLTRTIHDRGPRPLTTEGLLVWYGQAHSFDVETGQWPNEHEALLVELAALAGWKDVYFAERAPAVEGIDPPVNPAPPGTYVLMAWADGKSYVANAEDLGDWYDLGAVLQLLNTIARERGDTTRWISLYTGDQTANILAIPASAIPVAKERLKLGSAGASAADGKAFEERALRELLQEGGDFERDVVIPVE